MPPGLLTSFLFQPKDILEAAAGAARSAGLYLKENLSSVCAVEFKGVVDLVTEMDLRAETLIIEAIKKRFPDHGILTEESVEVASPTPYRWIIDPLDGTTNYAHGLPVFCVSIAFEENGAVMAGVVYDPTRDELFTALKGKGARLNGAPIRVSATPSLDLSLLATGFPYDVRTSRDNNLSHFANFAVRAQAIRRAGAAALDLAYVACGRFDGFWELKLRPWDVAAGALIITEARGAVTDFYNTPYSIYSGDILASNGLIHKEMLEVLESGF
jgi:myo-inositol-1(or 4)-monophosphatase